VNIRHVAHEMTLTYRADYDGIDARSRATGMEFEDGLARGGVFMIEDAVSRLFIVSGAIPKGAFPAPDGRWLELVQRVAAIQDRTRVVLRVPSRDITEDEIKRVFAVEEIVRTGYAEYSGTGTLRFQMGRPGASNVLEAFQEGPHPGAVLTSEETPSIFGVPVPLGRVAVIVTKYTLTDEDREALRTALADEKRASFDIRLTGDKDSMAQLLYEKWLSPDDKARVPANLFSGG
jgi:hypothetical protein